MDCRIYSTLIIAENLKIIHARHQEYIIRKGTLSSIIFLFAVGVLPKGFIVLEAIHGVSTNSLKIAIPHRFS